MATAFDPYLPEVQEQRAEFERVFGKEVSSRIEGEVEQYRGSRIQRLRARQEAESRAKISQAERERAWRDFQARKKTEAEAKAKTQAEKIRQQQQTEQTRRAEVQRERVISSLKRVEEGKITSYIVPTTEGNIKVSSKGEARDLRRSIEGRGRVRFGTTELQRVNPENPPQVSTREPTYKESIAGGRVIAGTLDYLSLQSTKLIKQQPTTVYDLPPYQRKGTYIAPSKIQTQQISEMKTTSAKESIQSVTRVAPYFATGFIGGSILIGAEGVESYATKGGRDVLKQTAEQSKLPKAVTYSIPAGEIAIGVLGVRSGISKLRTSAEAKAFKKTPTIVEGIRIEGAGKGYDILKATKTTKNAVYISDVRLPFVQARGGQRAVFEGGEGIAQSYLKTQKNIKRSVAVVDVGGFADKSKTIPIRVQTLKGETFLEQRILKQKLKGITPYTGKAVVDVRKVGTIELQENVLGMKRFKVDVATSNQKISQPIGGISKITKDKNVLIGEAGTIKSVRIRPERQITKLETSRIPVQEYLFKEVRAGRLNVSYLKPKKADKLLGKGTLGVYIPPSKGEKPIIGIRQIITSKQYQKLPKGLQIKTEGLIKETFAHELLHYKTPNILFAKPFQKLPYRLRPSEVIAYGLEKKYSRIGFKTSKLDITTIPKGPTTAVFTPKSKIILRRLDLNKIKTSDSIFKKVISSKTKGISQLQNIKISQVPTSSGAIASKTLQSVKPIVTKSTPAYVGGIGGVLSRSIFYGRGLGTSESITIQQPALRTGISLKSRVRTSVSPSYSQSIKLFTGQSSRQRILTQTRQLPRTLTTQQQRINLDTRQITRQKTLQSQRLGTQQRQIQLQRTVTAPPLGMPFITTVIPTTGTPFIFSLPKAKTKISTSRAGFGVSVRRYGKFKSIASGLSLPKAIGVGRTRVAGTLAATFKITPEKKGIVTGGFRTPKGFKRKKGLIFIEKPSLRLSTKGERQAIQIARVKGGSIKIK